MQWRQDKSEQDALRRAPDERTYHAACLLHGQFYMLHWRGRIGAAELRAVRRFRSFGMTAAQEVTFLEFMREIMRATNSGGRDNAVDGS